MLNGAIRPLVRWWLIAGVAAAACSHAPPPLQPSLIQRVLLPPPAPPPDPGAMITIRGVESGTLTGILVDAASTPPNRPLREARVMIDNRLGAATDSTGGFVIPHLTPGRHELRALAIGYYRLAQQVEIADSGGTAVVLRLVRQPILQLQEVCAGVGFPGIIAIVHDHEGRPAADGAKLLVVEGSYRDSTTEAIAGTSLGAAENRAGTYIVIVSKPGYKTVTISAVAVPGGKCGASTTVRVDVILEPATARPPR
jgi:hypothetical protein